MGLQHSAVSRIILGHSDTIFILQNANLGCWMQGCEQCYISHPCHVCSEAAGGASSRPRPGCWGVPCWGHSSPHSSPPSVSSTTTLAGCSARGPAPGDDVNVRVERIIHGPAVYFIHDHRIMMTLSRVRSVSHIIDESTKYNRNLAWWDIRTSPRVTTMKTKFRYKFATDHSI